MKKGKLNWRLLSGVGLMGFLSIVGAGAVRLYTQPLGNALDMPSRNESVDIVVQKATDTPVSATKIPTTPVPTNTPEGFCGETAVWNVLVLGSDAADVWYPPGADLTRVMRVDFQNKKVMIYAFSRDLWVDASELGFTNPIIESTKLGMVFYEARLRSTKTEPGDTMLDGINAMAKMLFLNFSVQSDHYIAIDLDQLPAMIDTVGGLPINIPKDFTEPFSGMAFKAGEQTLNGIQTATYARAYVDSDLSRIPRDNLVVEALRQKLLDPMVWVKIPQLFLQFKSAVVTDFSPEQVAHLACLMKELPKESITQDGIKGEWTSPGPEGSLLWDKTHLFDQLKGLGMIP